jgi:hypothetical protein
VFLWENVDFCVILGSKSGITMAFEENMKILGGAFTFPPVASPPNNVGNTPVGGGPTGGKKTTVPSGPAKPVPSKTTTKTYDPNLYKSLSDKYDQTYNSYAASLDNSQKTNYSGDIIKVKGGKDPGVKVPVSLLKDIVQSAKKNGYDPYMALAQVSQESSFGTDAGMYTKYDEFGQKMPSQPRTAIVQGLNLDEPYRPQEIAHFLSDNGVPGVKAKRDRVEGFTYSVQDEKKVNDYLNAHPELVKKYQAHLGSRTAVPKDYNAYDMAWKRDKTGLKNYNANPQYAKNITKYAAQLKGQKEIADLVNSIK